jgi:hypothetical protein
MTPGAKRLGHRWIERGELRVCINCSVMMERALNARTGRQMRVYKKTTFWSPERPECVFQ